MKSRIVIASLSIVLANVRAMADQQPPSDVDLIPDAAIQQPEAAPSSSIDRGNQRIYLEDALTGSDIRNNLLVPYPSPQPTDWQERVFLDARKDWKLDDDLHLNLSNRFNIRAESDITFPSHETVLDEFREAYVSWEPQERTYLDVGRINVKSGIALGFNPTDFFKTRAVVDPLSVDPTVLREDRLGTLMIEGQRIWEGGAVTAAFAPKLENPTALYTNTDLRTFDPSFDRTNASNRALIKADVNLTHEFAPEFLFDREGDRSSFGTNLTGAIGQRTVVYGEWSGGNRPSLIADALSYGRTTGSLPLLATGPLPASSSAAFQSSASIGASYTTDAKITFNLEFHHFQPGFSRSDWNTWFQSGMSHAQTAGIPAALWYIRGYALDQQDPISKQSAFLRFDWVDAFVTNLEVTGFINTDLYDASSLVQLTADYYLSKSWTVGALLVSNLGRARSDFGSLPQAGSALLKISRYF
jgi:hypothetical protein